MAIPLRGPGSRASHRAAFGVSTLRASIPIAQGLTPLREPRRYRAATTLRLRRSFASLRAATDRAVSLPRIGLNRIPQAGTTPRSSGPCRPGGSGFARWRVNPQAGSPPSLGALLPTRNGFAVPLRSHSRPLRSPRLRRAPPAHTSLAPSMLAASRLRTEPKLPVVNSPRRKRFHPKTLRVSGPQSFSPSPSPPLRSGPRARISQERDSRHARFSAGVRGTLRSTHAFFFYLLNALPPPRVSNRQFTLRPSGGARDCVCPF